MRPSAVLHSTQANEVYPGPSLIRKDWLRSAETAVFQALVPKSRLSVLTQKRLSWGGSNPLFPTMTGAMSMCLAVFADVCHHSSHAVLPPLWPQTVQKCRNSNATGPQIVSIAILLQLKALTVGLARDRTQSLEIGETLFTFYVIDHLGA
jgi:hypothetical protein